jgi:hypothetical protein
MSLKAKCNLSKGLSMSLMKNYFMRSMLSGAKLHTFLTLALDGDVWSISHSSHFIPSENDTRPMREEVGGYSSQYGREKCLPCQKSNTEQYLTVIRRRWPSLNLHVNSTKYVSRNDLSLVKLV